MDNYIETRSLNDYLPGSVEAEYFSAISSVLKVYGRQAADANCDRYEIYYGVHRSLYDILEKVTNILEMDSTTQYVLGIHKSCVHHKYSFQEKLLSFCLESKNRVNTFTLVRPENLEPERVQETLRALESHYGNLIFNNTKYDK